MEDQEKSGSKPLDTPTETATKFVSSVEGESVLLVEGVGISLAAFAGTSNYGDPKNYSLGASSEERTTSDVGTTLSGDNRGHIVAPINREFSVDTRFNDTNGEPDTGTESMLCRTVSFPYQPVGTNVIRKDDISGEKPVNASLLLQTECTPIEVHEVPSSELELHFSYELPTDTGPTSAYSLPLGAVTTTRSDNIVSADVDSDKIASLDVDGDKSAPVVEVPSSELELPSNNDLPADTGPTSVYSLPPGAEITTGSNKNASVDVDGDKSVVDVESDKSLLLQTEITPNEADAVPSSELELHAGTGATVGYSLPMGAEPTIRNEELASVDVDIDKSAWVDVQPVEVGGYDYRQTIGETLVQDSHPTKIADISDKEAERISSNNGLVVIVEKSSVDAGNTSNHVGSTNTDSISSPVFETNLISITANVVNDNPPENTNFMSQVKISPMSEDAEYMANGITNTYVVSSSSVDAADDVHKRLDSHVGLLTEDDPSAGAALDTGIRHPACDQSMLEGKNTDFESLKDVDSPAGAGHTIALIDGVHDIIGPSGEDTVPVTDIEPSDKAKFSPKTQGHLDSVPGMISLDSNKNGTSTDKFPSMEPDSAPAAVTDEGLGSDLKQEQDAIRTPEENSGGDVLVGQKVRKRFGNKQYIGEVVGFDQETSWYKVKYEDGDEEDLEGEELEPLLVQLKRGNSEIRRRKSRSRSGTGELRSFKRVQRPHGPIVSRVKVRGGSISDKQKSVENDDLKEDNKGGHDNEDHSMVDSADRLSSPMRTAKKRHSEQVNATPKRRKVDEGFPEHDQTTGTRATKKRKVDKDFPEHDQTTGTRATKRRKVDEDFPEHDQTTRTKTTKRRKVDGDFPGHDQATGTRATKRRKVDDAFPEHDQTTRTRTGKRRKVDEELPEHDQMTGTRTTRRSKVDEEFLEHDQQMTGTRTRNRLIVESRPRREKNLTENKVSTRRNSASSAINLEAVSGSNVDVSNSVPGFHDSAKSDSLESSQKITPAEGGGIALIGRKTKKDFGGQVYEGEVIDYDYKAKYYKVKYNDGDEEELEWTELNPTLVHAYQKPLSFKSMLRARNMAARPKVQDQSTSSKDDASKVNQTQVFHVAGAALNEQQKSPSVLEEVREGSHGKENSSGKLMVPVGSVGRISSPPRPLVAARFASAGDADIYEYFCWGEVIGFDKAKCPELRAAKLLPTSSPIVHLAASQHHLAAITAAGQVWLWRNKHGNIHTRCNEWEHIASLEEKGVVLVDIAGPDLDRASGGYEADQEDQVPDPFYLVAVGADGRDFILQGSQPQEPVRTYQLSDEPQHLSLKDVLLQSGHPSLNDAGQIVQVSVGTVEAPDESSFIGYITDTDHVYIRSATRDYMEEVNLVSDYSGKPIKIQCGRVYHAIIMTDDGRAWTWGRGYYPGLNALGSSGFSAATCQPAVGTLVGRKVIDVGCYGEDFIALTSDGDVHQWTHAVPNPAAGVYNVPATPLYGHGPCIPHGDKLRQVSIGAGMCAGITDGGRVHTWRTAMKGGLIGILVPEKEALTPLGHEESHKDTAIVNLGHRTATKVICVAGSLIVVVKKKTRGRIGPRKKPVKSNTESGIGGHS